MPLEIELAWNKKDERNEKKLAAKRKVTKKGEKRFKRLFENRFRSRAKNINCTIEEKIEEMVKVIKDVVPETRNKLNSKNAWFNDECEKGRLRMRGSLKKYRKMGNEEHRNEYLQLKKEYKIIMKEEKEKYFIIFAQ